jgi:hypothetical protein
MPFGCRAFEDSWVDNGAMAKARRLLRRREELFPGLDDDQVLAAVEARLRAARVKELNADAAQLAIAFRAWNNMEGPRPCLYENGRRRDGARDEFRVDRLVPEHAKKLIAATVEGLQVQCSPQRTAEERASRVATLSPGASPRAHAWMGVDAGQARDAFRSLARYDPEDEALYERLAAEDAAAEAAASWRPPVAPTATVAVSGASELAPGDSAYVAGGAAAAQARAALAESRRAAASAAGAAASRYGALADSPPATASAYGGAYGGSSYYAPPAAAIAGAEPDYGADFAAMMAAYNRLGFAQAPPSAAGAGADAERSPPPPAETAPVPAPWAASGDSYGADAVATAWSRGDDAGAAAPGDAPPPAKFFLDSGDF